MARIAEDAGILFEYSVNEKIAVEVSFAASLAGARSMCGMKHLGLSYASDPVSSMPYVGVEGGMVIVSAGDPSAITSPNEQDQRHFSDFLYLPVFDPATPEDARSMTRYAFRFSEQTRLPVVMRPTTRICHSSGMVTLAALPAERNPIEFTKNPSRYVPIPANARRMRKELTERYRLAEELLGGSGFFPRTGSGRHGIVASGIGYAYALQAIEELGIQQEVTLQQIGAYPIPEKVLAEFLGCVESVLVIEELTPYVEDRLCLSAFRRGKHIPVFGKNSGHFPLEYEYSPDLVEDAIRKYLGLGHREVNHSPAPDLPPRPPVLCPGCPHRTILYLTRKIFGKATVYCNDIGCYTLGYGEPLHCCDVLLCMGSSISQASGMARLTGKRTVAFIGDSTFYHSGLPALANAVQSGDEITVIILDNYITGMTGFQPSLTTGNRPPGDGERPTGADVSQEEAPRFSIEETVRGLGVNAVYSVGPSDEPYMVEALKSSKRGRGVQVVIYHAPCAANESRLSGGQRRKPMVVDQERCNACSLCVRALGCPAILVIEGAYVIDQELCNGCKLCANICTYDAIKQVAAENV
jgi:indolepyruvate ferredoxin oxidoreductase alpha subunit